MVFQNPDLQLFNASVRQEILYRLNDPDLELYQRLIAWLGLARYERPHRFCSARVKSGASPWQPFSCTTRATACSWTSLHWGRTQPKRPH